MSAEDQDKPFPTRINPVDPALSADVGIEKKRRVLLASCLAVAVIAVAVWAFVFPHGPKPPELTFRSPDIGCTFQFSSRLTGGPNFVRTEAGSVLTIERHSLFKAKKSFLESLPEGLFEQVMIQIDENYQDVEERSRTQIMLDGRKAFQAILKGNSRSFKAPTVITITICATKDWVYVLRSYSDEKLDATERPYFQRVLETWKFLP